MSKDESMVERVARIIALARWERDYGEVLKDDELLEDCTVEAKAAIRAMREPTDEMVEAIVVRHSNNADPPHRQAIDGHRAAIDKALEE